MKKYKFYLFSSFCKKFINSFIKNKSYQWMFSGIGVFVLTVVANSFITSGDLNAQTKGSSNTVTSREEAFMRHVISEAAIKTGMTEEFARLTLLSAATGNSEKSIEFRNSAFNMWAAEEVPSYKIGLTTATTAAERMSKLHNKDIGDVTSTEILVEAMAVPCEYDISSTKQEYLADLKSCMENQKVELGEAAYTLLDVISSLYKDREQVERDFKKFSALQNEE